MNEAAERLRAFIESGVLLVGNSDGWQEVLDAALATERQNTMEAVLRGLRSEDQTTQVRAIIANVEAMLTPEEGGSDG